MSYPVTDIEDIDADEAEALKCAGIRTTEKLLEAAKSPKGRKLLAGKTSLDEKRLLRWANIADKLRIKGMGKEYAGLLARGRRRYREGTAVPQPGEARQSHGRGQQEAKAGPLLAVREAGDALGRARQKLPLKITY